MSGAGGEEGGGGGLVGEEAIGRAVTDKGVGGVDEFSGREFFKAGNHKQRSVYAKAMAYMNQTRQRADDHSGSSIGIRTPPSIKKGIRIWTRSISFATLGSESSPAHIS